MQDGHIVFQGTTQRSQKYFSEQGYKIARYSNPADIYLKILAINYPKTDHDIQKIKSIVNNYKSKQLEQIHFQIELESFGDLRDKAECMSNLVT